MKYLAISSLSLDQHSISIYLKSMPEQDDFISWLKVFCELNSFTIKDMEILADQAQCAVEFNHQLYLLTISDTVNCAWIEHTQNNSESITALFEHIKLSFSNTKVEGI